MPRDDPADMIAQSWREMGLSSQLEQPWLRVPPNPLCGGSTGYAEWFRRQQIEKYDNDEPINCSKSSILQWKERLVQYCPTGNRPRSQIVGVVMLQLCQNVNRNLQYAYCC